MQRRRCEPRVCNRSVAGGVESPSLHRATTEMRLAPHVDTLHATPDSFLPACLPPPPPQDTAKPWLQQKPAPWNNPDNNHDNFKFGRRIIDTRPGRGQLPVGRHTLSCHDCSSVAPESHVRGYLMSTVRQYSNIHAELPCNRAFV